MRQAILALAGNDDDSVSWAIVLGASVIGGRPCALLQDRLVCAAELIHARRATRVFVSGGPHEVEPMRGALVALGVDDDQLELDPRGLRTLLTMVNARTRGIERALVVTNPFHLKRSVFLANSQGIDATGVAAPAVSGASPRALRRARVREVFAHIRARLDVLRA